MDEHLLAAAAAAPLRHPLDDPRMAAFVDGIDPVNRLAEEAPGLMWRCRGPAGHADGAPERRIASRR